MGASHSAAEDMAAKEIVIERVLDAPRERVFEVFTKPEHLKKWWGPEMVSVTVAEFEARPGGRIFLGERGPDGTMNYVAGVVREIERPTRIVLAMHFANERKERVVPPAISGLPVAWQGEIVATVLFAAEGQRTRLTVRQSLWSLSAEWGELARAGWGQTLDKLERVVRSLEAGGGGSV